MRRRMGPAREEGWVTPPHQGLTPGDFYHLGRARGSIDSMMGK